MIVTDLVMMRHAEQVGRPGTHEAELQVELSPRGHEQARLLAERLRRDPPFDCLASSPFRRALQTASLLGGEVTILDDLGELVQPEARDAARRAVWDRQEFPPPEAIAAFFARCTRQLEQLVDRFAGRRIGVVAHAGVVKMLFLHALQIPVARCTEIEVKIDHASISHWRHHRRNDRVYWELVSANDVAHLR